MTAVEQLAQAVLDGRVTLRATAVHERGVLVASDFTITVDPAPDAPARSRYYYEDPRR